VVKSEVEEGVDRGEEEVVQAEVCTLGGYLHTSLKIG